VSTERGLSRTEAEKLGRMAECWRADRFSGEEVTSAMHRWSYRRHAPRLPSLRQVLLLVAAGSLSTGGALALSGALHLPGRAELQRDGADAPAGKARVQRKPRVYWELGGQRVEPHGESHVELGPGETLTWVVDDARTELSGPGVVKLSRTGPEQGWVAAFRPRGSGDGWAASASPPPRLSRAPRVQERAQAPPHRRHPAPHQIHGPTSRVWAST